MPPLIIFSNCVVAIYGFYILSRIIHSIKRPNLFVLALLIFLLFFWFPILLDLSVGIPNYNETSRSYWKFQEATRDSSTIIIYNTFVVFILFLLNKNRKKRLFDFSQNEKFTFNEGIKRIAPIIYLVTFIPLLILPLIPPEYLIYEAIRESDNESIRNIMKFCTLAALSGPFLIVHNSQKKGGIFINVLILLAISVAIFLHGKRSIMAIFLATFFLVSYIYGIKNKQKFLFNSLIITIFFAVFIIVYGKNISNDFDDTYAKLRIDFGRDSVTKYVIYTVLVKGESILQYIGESFVFDFTFFIPREIWPGKPWPYAVSLTNHLVGNANNDYIGWGVTTSIFEEFISNFKWFGLVLGPFIYISLIKRLNSLPFFSKVCGLFLLCMLEIIQFAAITVIFIIFITLRLLKK